MLNRLAFVDVLRGLSVLYIVGFWHMMNYVDGFAGYSNAVTTRITVTILGLFVYMSGYLLGQKNVQKSRQGIKDFYIRRYLRIYPLYLGAILLFLVFKLSDAATLLKAALLVSMFIGPPPVTLWFITMLMVFYIFTPFLMAVSGNNVRFLGVVAGIFGCFLLVSWLSPTGDPRIVIYFPAFALGIYVAGRIERVEGVSWLLGLLAIAISLGSSLAVDNFPEMSYLSVPLASLMPLVVFFLLRHFNPLIPEWRIFGALAYAGFVMYLIHRPIFAGMRRVYFPDSPVYQIIYMVLIGMPVILSLSWLAQKAYDHIVVALSRSAVRRAR
jgi:peptidoglycan/LPS O-acetylase OafA/YrhL